MQSLLQYLAGLANDPAAQQSFAKDPEAAISAADLNDSDKAVLRTRNPGLIHATVGQQAVAAVIYGQAPPSQVIYATGTPSQVIYASGTPSQVIYASGTPSQVIYASGAPQVIYSPGVPVPAPVIYAPVIYGAQPSQVIYCAQHPAVIYGAQPSQVIYGAQAPAVIYGAQPAAVIYSPAPAKPGDTK